MYTIAELKPEHHASTYVILNHYGEIHSTGYITRWNAQAELNRLNSNK